MIKKGNKKYNERCPKGSYIDMNDVEADGDILPELSIYIELAVKCIKKGVQTPHANNENIVELYKFDKEFTAEVVQVDLPACIVNYKPIVIKPKAKPRRAKARQKDIKDIKNSLFK